MQRYQRARPAGEKMETDADAIVSRLQTAVANGTVDAASIQAVYAALQALPLVSEQDRLTAVLGVVRVNDLLLQFFADAAPAELLASAERVRAMAARRYANDDTPYRRSRREVISVAQRLAAGDAAGEVAEQATERLLTDMTDPEDSEDVAVAIHAVHALRAAHELLLTPELIAPSGEAGPVLIGVDVALRDGTMTLGQLVTVQEALVAQRCALDETPAGHARALMALLGIGLRHDPHALPALEPLLAGIMAELTRIEMSVAEAAAAPRSHRGQCEAFVAACAREVAAGVAVDEHLLQRWTAELQALEAASDAEPLRTLDVMVRVISLAEQHATGDTRTMLAAQLAGLQAMRDQIGASPGLALDAEGVGAELARMRREADARIAAGESAEVVMAALFAAWPAMMPRLGQDPDPRAVAALLTGLVDLLSGLEQTVPPDKREAFADTMATMRSVMHEAMSAVQAPADTAADPLLAQSVSHQMAGLMQGVSEKQPQGVAPWGRQLVEGLGLLTSRVLRVCEERGLARDDEQAQRLKGRIDIVLGRLRGAGTDPERFATQLQKGLRPLLLALRRFERRHHAMLVQAPYPPRASTPDANVVHLAVGETVRPLVEAALSAVTMAAATPFGAGDPLQLRWHQLRRAAVAVLDYTAYDPAQADPPGPLPTDPGERQARLAAAAPVAATAFEHGWAMALGTPVVPLVRAGAPLPFDVTSAAVALHDDGHDLDRLAAAIHGALLPDEWLGDQDSAAATVAQLHAAFSSLPGTVELLKAMGDGHDGMALVLAAEALIQRAPGANQMLAFPSFAPVYPDPALPPLVFHVTAFRPWSRACEVQVRAACQRAGWRYAIGYERLDPDIMAAIWRDIAQAALVVADVTALNPNAVLELGLAHGLGRPLVVIARQPDTPRWLPALAKVRVHEYEADSEHGCALLAALLDEHLARAAALHTGG